MSRVENRQAEVVERALGHISVSELGASDLDLFYLDDESITVESILKLAEILSAQLMAQLVLPEDPEVRDHYGLADYALELDIIKDKAKIISALRTYAEYTRIQQEGLDIPAFILNFIEKNQSMNSEQLLAITDQIEGLFLNPDEAGTWWEVEGDREFFFQKCWEMYQVYFNIEYYGKNQVADENHGFGNYAWMKYAQGLEVQTS